MASTSTGQFTSELTSASLPKQREEGKEFAFWNRPSWDDHLQHFAHPDLPAFVLALMEMVRKG